MDSGGPVQLRLPETNDAVKRCAKLEDFFIDLSSNLVSISQSIQTGTKNGIFSSNEMYFFSFLFFL